MALEDKTLAGVQVGANIGNMRVQQAERAMQLRAQAALQAVHERQLAAQADMLEQHAQLYRVQAAKVEEAQKQETAQLAAANDLYHYNTEVMGQDSDTAMRNAIAALQFKNPVLAQKVAATYANVKKAQTAGQPTPHQATLEDIAQKRLDLTQKTQTRLEGREQRLTAKEQRVAAAAPVREQIKQLNKQIDTLQRQHDKLVPENLAGQSEGTGIRPVSIQRMHLAQQIQGLRDKVVELSKNLAGPAAPKVPEGRVAVQDKDGNLFHVPQGQLDQARKAGYLPVEEATAPAGDEESGETTDESDETEE